PSTTTAPHKPAVELGNTLQFTATGHRSDGSTYDLTSSVTWSSTNNGAAGISAAGLATAHNEGATIIGATYLGLSDEVRLAVLPPVASITVFPSTLSLPIRIILAFPAEAQLVGGGTRDVTDYVAWSSSDESVATISSELSSAGHTVGHVLG